ncbi:MAG: cytochrome c [Pseudomonadota bacterium]
MQSTRLACLAFAAAAAFTALPAAAQFAKPGDAVKYRQSALTLMSAHFGRIAAMANGKVPFDAKVASENADLVATLSHLPWAGFGPGTEGGKAKPEVWQEQGKFKENSEKLMAETAKLAAAAKTGNLDSIKAAVGSTGASCKACHDTFRSS